MNYWHQQALIVNDLIIKPLHDETISDWHRPRILKRLLLERTDCFCHAETFNELDVNLEITGGGIKMIRLLTNIIVKVILDMINYRNGYRGGVRMTLWNKANKHDGSSYKTSTKHRSK